ncbi:PREDICTED: UBP1-associated protein 2A [Nelumbo nucifera]|uniref:UBP1-associated protein 2A n=1 Tax=Nelumbo nucifera TaxID=4432 RepID=A0A1U7ZFK1_NELNU|nr:PREDICTED: UBP1-associated protein 2A [Nelumbo nucifera]XP_010251684.1 PREDICTED: UBP1-associated protein 2A [Nelumbo nucifera]XP_010251685.1 PREDICTED: UBP1-associated protein 2A [Nelumbo nucifera]
MAKKRKLEPKIEAEPANTVEEQEQQQQEEQLEEQAPFEVDDEEVEQIDTEDPEDGEEDEEEETENNDNAPETSNANASPIASAAGEAAPAPSSAHADGDGTDEGDDDTEEPVQKLLEPFTKDQLIDLLREAADQHSDIMDRIRKVADVDPVHRKIFVHGLGWDTNAEILINVFKKYGEIEDCNAVIDKITGKSKGYGFILFKHRSGARKALKQPQKRIGNRMTACQLASAGPVPPATQAAPPAPPVSEYTQRKIYVSNVSADIDPQRLLNFFSKYGEIEEGPLGLDKQTGKPKGFALFVYKSIDSAKKALEEPHKNYEGHILHCQKAIDGPKPNKPYYHHHNPHHSSSTMHGSHFQRNENPNFMGSMGNHAAAAGPGHMMAPSAAGVSFNQGAPQTLNPALGQAIALLATQGAGLGLTNLLGTLGSTGMGAQVNQTVPPMVNNAGHGMQGGYGSQAVGSNISPGVMAGYGNQPGMQGGYPNPQMGQPNAGRSQQGVGHMGGVAPYMGH